MNELLKIILSLSFSGTVLIFVLLLCKPFIKNKLSKRWQYYIWLIVVARLLFPFAPEISLMGMLFQHFDYAVIQTDASLQLEQKTPVFPETDFASQYNTSGQVSKNEREHSESEELSASSLFDMVKQNITILSLLVWLIVAIGLLIRKVTIYQSFVKYIRVGRIEVSDMALWERMGKLVEQTGLKGAVGLYTNRLISSPLLIGFFRPSIILPSLELPDSDFQYTILHELTHYKRRDMFYKWLVQAAICLHWFNPFVYLMGREVNHACELSCDEAVIRSLDAGQRRAYGDTLLNAMGTGSTYTNPLACVTLNEGKKLLKERLDAIMKFKKKSVLVLCATVLLTVLLLFGFTFTGAYAITQQDNAATFLPNQSKQTINDTMGQPDSLSQIFEKYKPYGVVYNAEKDTAYYNGEKIKLFVEFMSEKPEGITYAFEFCYQDSKTDSTLYLEAVKDGSDNIKEIRLLKEEVALDLLYLLEDIVTAYPISNSNKTNSCVTLDATQELEHYGIVATDKNLTKDSVAQNIKDWIAQCDKNKKQGAYISTSKFGSGYITYVYYNGGGRYPWNLSVDNDTIHLNLYSDTELTATDGYCLISFTTPKEYKNILLYFDNKPQQVTSILSSVTDDISNNISLSNDSKEKKNNQNIETIIIKNETWYLISNEAQLRAIGTGEYGLE